MDLWTPEGCWGSLNMRWQLYAAETFELAVSLATVNQATQGFSGAVRHFTWDQPSVLMRGFDSHHQQSEVFGEPG